MISFLNKTILQFEEIEIYLPSAGDLRLLRFWWHVDLTRISSDVYQWHLIYRVVLLFQWSCTLIEFSAWHVGRDVDFESHKFLLLLNILSLSDTFKQNESGIKAYRPTRGVISMLNRRRVYAWPASNFLSQNVHLILYLTNWEKWIKRCHLLKITSSDLILVMTIL